MDNNLYTDTLQICRTCMKGIIDTSFFYLDCTPAANTQITIKQTLYSCIPELDLSIVSDPVICSKCVDNLLSVFEFKKTCLQSEIQINKYIQEVEHIGDLNLLEVVQFHQPDVKNLDVEVKMEGLEITEEDLVCDTRAFKEGSECAESCHQPDIKNLDIKVKMEDLEIREDFKNEDLVCETSEFNEASKCTESTELKYLLELQMVDMQDVLFNTFDDYNINYNLSAAEENSSTHNRNIAQNGLREVIEHQDHSYSKNLNKTNAYYQCYRCGHQAESKLKLILHLKHHTQKNFYHEEIISRFRRYYKKVICYYRCSLCNYLTKYKYLFDLHIRIHLIKKNYKRILCKLTNAHTKVFHTTIQVNKTNIKGNKRKCVKLCKNYYKHNFKNQSKSKRSEQHLNHRNSLKPNMRADIIVEKLFKCSICEYQCNFKVNLKQHMQIHTGEKLFACSVCEYQCSYKSNFKRHMRIHTHTGEKPFSCSVCEYQFGYKSSLKQHMIIHTGKKPFSCSVCEYQCSYKGSLKQHMIIHTGKKPFSCSVCEYQCSYKGSLKQHMIIHTRDKSFSCSLCEYHGSYKANLKRHIMQHHTGEKPFLCCVCKYQCTHKCDLKKHMLIHTGEKPFSCSVCEYQCSRKSCLNQHMRIHIGDKSFSCSVCEYQCTVKSKLKRHMRIHTGDKPFSCSLCKYQCSMKSHLKRHICEFVIRHRNIF